jgi:hypothetical protein
MGQIDKYQNQTENIDSIAKIRPQTLDNPFDNNSLFSASPPPSFPACLFGKALWSSLSGKSNDL